MSASLTADYNSNFDITGINLAKSNTSFLGKIFGSGYELDDLFKNNSVINREVLKKHIEKHKISDKNIPAFINKVVDRLKTLPPEEIINRFEGKFANNDVRGTYSVTSWGSRNTNADIFKDIASAWIQSLVGHFAVDSSHKIQGGKKNSLFIKLMWFILLLIIVICSLVYALSYQKSSRIINEPIYEELCVKRP